MPYQAGMIGYECSKPGCTGQMVIHVTDNPPAPNALSVLERLINFRRRYGRESAGLIVRRAAIQIADNPNMCHVLNQLANELDELCKDE